MYVYIYIYIYTHRERERESERNLDVCVSGIGGGAWRGDLAVRPISVLRFWITEGLTQA